jgi:hypothetical protein
MNNAGGRMLVRGIVVLILMAMFLSGVFMISEGVKKDPAAEPQKKWFGAGHVIAAGLLGVGYIVMLQKRNSSYY